MTRRRCIILLVALAVALIVLAAPRPAEALKIAPFKATLVPQDPAAWQVFMIENNSSEPAAVQVGVTTWEVDFAGQGTNHTAEDEFTVFPAQLILQQHESRAVRVRTMVETLFVVWSRYRAGQIGILIRVDDRNISPDEERRKKPTLKGSKVLLAEDSRINQAFVQDVLEQMECEIIIVPNGREAVAAVRDDDFDLVLMDCQMPVMDGFEAARQIRALAREGFTREDLPVIALTANAMKGDRQRCLEAGMNDYLPKPVRTRDLKEKIYYWIRKEQVSFDDTDGLQGGDFSAVSGAADNITQDNTAQDQVFESGIIDPAAIDEARRILKDKYDMMVDCYIEDVTSYIGEIEQAFARGDIASMVRPAHTIKSTSRRMGACAMADKAQVLEEIAHGVAESGDMIDGRAGIRHILEDMGAVFAQTQKGFRRGDGSHRTA